MANANAIAFLAWLQNPTGVGNAESAQAIVNQGIETLDNLNLLDDDDINIICDGARKPGGFIKNLNDATLMIPNPGRPIPALFQMKLKLSAMATQPYLTVSRPMTAALLSWEQTSHFWDLRRLNENWTESEALPPLRPLHPHHEDAGTDEIPTLQDIWRPKFPMTTPGFNASSTQLDQEILLSSLPELVS